MVDVDEVVELALAQPRLGAGEAQVARPRRQPADRSLYLRSVPALELADRDRASVFEPQGLRPFPHELLHMTDNLAAPLGCVKQLTRTRFSARVARAATARP